MWTSFVLLTFVGLVAASSLWQPNKQYEYQFVANTLTGSEQGRNQYAGILTRGKLVLQPQSENSVRGVMKQVQHVQFHGQILGGLDGEITEDFWASGKQGWPGQDAYFVLSYENGIVKSLEVDSSLNNDQINRLKGILSSLQVNMTVAESQMRDTESNSGMQKSMESSVTGDCEVMYEASPVPAFAESQQQSKWGPKINNEINEDLFQFVKTVNYSHCYHSNGYNFRVQGPKDVKPNTNQMGNLLSRSTVTRVVTNGSGNQLTIRSAKTVNHVTVQNYLPQGMPFETVSRIEIKLESMGDNTEQSQPPSPYLPVGCLAYQYNKSSQQHQEQMNYIRKHNDRYPDGEHGPYLTHPDLKEATLLPFHPYSLGYNGGSIHTNSSFDAISEIDTLVKEIIDDLQMPTKLPSVGTMGKYMILADLIQTLSFDQIEMAVQRVSQNQKHEWAYDVVLDAIAQAGTNPAVLYIVQNAANGGMPPCHVDSLVETALNNLITPTEPIMQEIFEKLIKNRQLQQEVDAYAKVLLAYTDLIRHTFSDRNTARKYVPVQTYGPFAGKLKELVLNRVMPYLAQQLGQYAKQNETYSQIYIRALGNIAHPEVMKIFEQYLENANKATSQERLAIVAALDKLIESHPKLAQKILFNIFASVSEQPELRCKAVALLMRTNPPVGILQRMAMSTYNDPSIAVRTIVKYAIDSAAQLTSQENAQLASRAKAAQAFLNSLENSYLYTKTELADDIYDRKYHPEESQFTYITGSNSSLPRVVSFSAWNKAAGVSGQMYGGELLLSDIEGMLNLIAPDWHPGSGNSPSHPQQWKAQQNTKDDEGIAGQLLVSYLGKKSLWAFDSQRLQSLPKRIANLAQRLSSGYQVSYNKIFDNSQMQVAFPLATGYPFFYSYRSPVLMQAVGEMKVKVSPSISNLQSFLELAVTKAVNVTSKMRLTFSREDINVVGFFAPTRGLQFTAGQTRTHQVHVPMNVNLNLDFENTVISAKIAPLATQNRITLIHSSSWPFTSVRSATCLRPYSDNNQSNDVKLIHVRPDILTEETVGEQSIGMSFHYGLRHELPQNVVNALSRYVKTKGIEKYTELPKTFINMMDDLSNQRLTGEIGDYVDAFTSIFMGAFGTDVQDLAKFRAVVTLPFQNIGNVIAAAIEDYAEENDYQEVSVSEDSIGMYKYEVNLDVASSANQIIRFGMVLNMEDKIKGQESKPGKLRGPTDESKLAVVSDISPNSDARRKEMMANAAYKMNKAYGGLIDYAMTFEGSKPAKFIGTYSQATNYRGDRSRILLFSSVKRASGSRPRQIYVTLARDYNLPPVLNYNDAIQHKASGNIKLDAYFGESGKVNKTHISVEASLGQSPEVLQQLHETPAGEMCLYEMKKELNYQMPACQNATYYANVFTNMNIQVNGENLTPRIRSWGHDALMFLNHYGYFQGLHDHEQTSKADQFQAQVRINPFESSANVSLRLPSGKQTFYGLQIPHSVAEVLFIHPVITMNECPHRTFTQNEGVCVIDYNKIHTFDQAIVWDQEIRDCWYTVVSQAQSSEQTKQLEIETREANANKGERELRIKIADQELYFQPPTGSSAPPQVKLNGKQESLSEENTIEAYEQSNLVAIISCLYGNEVIVVLPQHELTVYYNGKHIRIDADYNSWNQVAGLCGNYNGERFDDVAKPNEQILHNPKHFVSAWARPSEQCSDDVKKAHQAALSSKSYPRYYQPGNVFDDRDIEKHSENFSSESYSEEEDEQNGSHEQQQRHRHHHQGKLLQGSNEQGNCLLTQRVQFVEDNNQYCFTKVDVNDCPNKCQPNRMQTVNVPVHCRAKNDSVARLYIQQIKRGSKLDLESKRTHRTISIEVPESCSQEV